MEFIVPQFIEREPRIIGPFTFKQFIFIGIAGGLSIFLYFLLPFFLFLIIAVGLTGGALALAFFKMGGFPLPKLLQNFLIFLTKPKVYLWHRKAIPPKIFKKTLPPKEEAKEESILKVSEKSHLEKLHAILESKTR